MQEMESKEIELFKITVRISIQRRIGQQVQSYSHRIPHQAKGHLLRPLDEATPVTPKHDHT